LALFELFGWLKYFREQRRQENLSQRELLNKELLLLAYAILGVFVVMGFLIALAWIFTR
jgi:polyferredoxin